MAVSASVLMFKLSMRAVTESTLLCRLPQTEFTNLSALDRDRKWEEIVREKE